MFMTIADLHEAIRRAYIIVDTREKTGMSADGKEVLYPAAATLYAERINQIQAEGLCVERRKLNFGDYTIATSLAGAVLSMENILVVERKATADEIVSNMTGDRERFERELAAASAAGAKMIMIVEDDARKIWTGEYRSKANPTAMTGSMINYEATAGLSIWPIPAGKSGTAIARILKKNLETFLKRNFVI